MKESTENHLGVALAAFLTLLILVGVGAMGENRTGSEHYASPMLAWIAVALGGIYVGRAFWSADKWTISNLLDLVIIIALSGLMTGYTAAEGADYDVSSYSVTRGFTGVGIAGGIGFITGFVVQAFLLLNQFVAKRFASSSR